MKTRNRRALKISVAVIVLLVLIRAALPYAVLHLVNKQLAQLEGFEAHVADVDLSLWRGAYQIQGLEIRKKGKDGSTPFVAIPVIDLSVYWAQLFKGAVVGEIYFTEPQINFVDGGSAKESQTGEGESWVQVVRSLAPIRIDRLEITNGSLHFKTPHSKPPVDLYFQQFNGVVKNLTNVENKKDGLPSEISVSAKAMKSGDFELLGKLDPFASPPNFDLQSKLLKLDLRELNAFLKHYASMDVEAGTFSLVTEINSNQGKLSGYAKPIFKGMEVLTWKEDVEEDGDGLFNIIWQAIVGTAGELLENQDKDQFATKIPIEGTLDNPDTDVLAIIGGVLKNAFIRAIMPWYDGTSEEKEEG